MKSQLSQSNPLREKNKKNTESSALQRAQTDRAGEESTFAAYGDTATSIAQLIKFTGAT